MRYFDASGQFDSDGIMLENEEGSIFSIIHFVQNKAAMCRFHSKTAYVESDGKRHIISRLSTPEESARYVSNRLLVCRPSISVLKIPMSIKSASVLL